MLGNAWPGRTGMYDRLVFLAHLSIAQLASHLTYGASEISLGDMAGILAINASCATRRRCNYGYLDLVQKAVGDRAAIYRINQNGQTITGKENPNEC